MPQLTSGLYRLTQVPFLYESFQNLLGAQRSRTRLAREFILPFGPKRVVDVGCGPGSMLPFLGKVDYQGIDLNSQHIERAQALYDGLGRFYCGGFERLAGVDEEQDLVLSIGLLHHLNDDEVRTLSATAARILRPGGHLVTVDPAFTPDQHWMARWIASKDAGQAVRSPDGYRALITSAFETVRSTVLHDLGRIPLTHCINIATKPTN